MEGRTKIGWTFVLNTLTYSVGPKPVAGPKAQKQTSTFRDSVVSQTERRINCATEALLFKIPDPEVLLSLTFIILRSADMLRYSLTNRNTSWFPTVRVHQSSGWYDADAPWISKVFLSNFSLLGWGNKFSRTHLSQFCASQLFMPLSTKIQSSNCRIGLFGSIYFTVTLKKHGRSRRSATGPTVCSQ